jgi:hypothetical protein
MAGTDSIVGMAGLIPEDMYLRKITRSCVFEDENQIENYQRNLLKDTNCDAPFFESDMPRRDFQSTAVIDLRDGGRRSKAESDLPDGLQLNFDPWLDNSPPGPDMMKHREQQEARAKYIKFYPDSDDSVPESGINITRMVKQIKAAQTWVQNRLKIFETSKDNVQHGFLAQNKTCEVDKYQNDVEIPQINDCPADIRMGATSDFANKNQLGYLTDVDHSFKIAKYGMIKAGSKATDFFINREGAFIDHRLPVSYEGTNISPDLALLMVDLARAKAHAHQIGKDNLVFPEVIQSANRTFKITPADMAGIKNRETVQTAALAANLLFEGKMIHTPGLVPNPDFDRYYTTIIDPEIIEFIASMLQNKKMAPRETDDLREKIEQTAVKSGVYVMDKAENHRKTGAQVYEALISREAIDDHTKQESKKIFNYAALKPSADGGVNTMDLQLTEAYKSVSKERANMTGNTDFRLPNKLNVVTHEPLVFNPLAGKTKERFTRGLGSKYNFGNMDTEDQDRLPDRESR